MAGVLAQPFIVMRNDHQDALSAGLAVSEYAPTSKSADEIRGLWQWIEAKLNIGAALQEEQTVELSASPEILSAMFVQTPAEAAELVS
jgi:chromosome partitioning protein